jgi:magnesium transporter
MISAHFWNSETRSGRSYDADGLRARLPELKDSQELCWIDLADPTEEEERLIFEEFFPVHSLTLDDITRQHRFPGSQPHLPKAEEFPDYLFVVVNPLAKKFLDSLRQFEESPDSANPSPTTQLSAVLTERLLITHHYEPVACVEECRSFLGRHQKQAERGPDFLFHLILDSTVDGYAIALDHFQEALDDAESQVFGRPGPQLLVSLLQLKREIIVLRKTLVYEREVLARLSRGEFALIEDREMVYYRNVYDHLVRFTELIESSREMVSDLMQTHLAAVSNKLNEIMKVLTMISTVVLPMTLIAGIYGMNFEHQPEFKWLWGYPWALGLMILTALASFIFFRWRRWI